MIILTKNYVWNQTITLFVQNVTNLRLFDSSDFWFNFTIIDQHALTGAPVAKSVVSMLSCSIIYLCCLVLLLSSLYFPTVYA